MARAKPSSAHMTTSVDTISFQKEFRQQIINMILEKIPRNKIREHEVYNLLKVRYRAKGVDKVPCKKDVIRLSRTLDRIISALPNKLKLKGQNELVGKVVKKEKPRKVEGKIKIDEKLVDVWIYNDKLDSDVCRQFFLKLEAAVEAYLADKQLDDSRPTQKNVKEYFQRLDKVCENLEKRFNEIDDASRAFAAGHDVDVEEYIEHIHKLRQVCTFSQSLKVSKKSQAKLNICVAVGRALNTIGVAATTSRIGLMDSLLSILFESISEEVGDIQDQLRVALTSGIYIFPTK